MFNTFGFEYDEKEEREALLEAGRLNAVRELLYNGLITLEVLKASGLYSPEELNAVASRYN